ELARLTDFFEDTATCAQRKFADYFGVPELPYGCCGSARCRCSACWIQPDWPPGEHRPTVAQAFESAAPRAGGHADEALRIRRLDGHVYRFLRLLPHGAHPRVLWHALRGEESSYNPMTRRQVLLPRAL